MVDVQFFDPGMTADIKRRQALAAQLQELGKAKDTQVIGGWAVPQSGLEELAKGLATGYGAYQQGTASGEEQGQAKARQQLYKEAFDKMQGGNFSGAADTLSQDPESLAEALKIAAEGKSEITKDAMGNPIAVNPYNPSQITPIGSSPFGGGMQAPIVTSQQFANGLSEQDPTKQFIQNNPLPPIAQSTQMSAGGAPGISGDDYLKSLSPQIATQVKALAEGRMAFPGGFALKSPYWQQMISAVSQYDPSFDAVNYNARTKTRNDFTSGKSAQNTTSIGTAINTLGQLEHANEKLGGAQYGNTLRNWALGQQSDPNLVSYNNLSKAAADEVTKAIVGAGGTGGDRDTRQKIFSANQSPEARKAAISSALQELNSRLEPLANQYNTGMGTSKKGIELMSPESQKAYMELTGQQAPITNATGVQQGNVPQQSPQGPPPDAIAHLKANPQLAPYFEQKYGVSAKSYLGGQ